MNAGSILSGIKGGLWTAPQIDAETPVNLMFCTYAFGHYVLSFTRYPVVVVPVGLIEHYSISNQTGLLSFGPAFPGIAQRYREFNSTVNGLSQNIGSCQDASSSEFQYKKSRQLSCK